MIINQKDMCIQTNDDTVQIIQGARWNYARSELELIHVNKDVLMIQLVNNSSETGYISFQRAPATGGVPVFSEMLRFTYTDGDVHLATIADKTLVFDQPLYNDANLGGMALKAGVTSPPVTQWVDNLGANTGIYGLGFAVNDEANGSIEIPHDYKEGTNITFHVHWGAVAAPSGTDYVKWTLTYNVQRVDTTFTPAVQTSVETAYDTQYESVRSDFTAITGTNFKIGDQFNFNLKRVTAAGDAFSGVAIIQTAGFHYQCDTLGSRSIGTK